MAGAHRRYARPNSDGSCGISVSIERRLPDIQRGITRILHRTASSSEFIAVIQAILVAGKQLQKIHIEEDNNSMGRSTVCSSLLQKLISTASSSNVMHTATVLLSTLNKEAADQKDLHNLFIISDGKFPEVVEAQRSVRLANQKLDSLIDLYKKQLKIRNLEYTTVSGVTHLMELPLDVKVPLNWMKVNSTKKAIRYHPPEVITVLDQLSLAKEELTVVCRSAWNDFLKSFDGYYGEFQASVQALASLDCLNALAILSRNKNYTRPVFAFDDEPVQIHISNGRHPVLETVLQDNFVPNNSKLHAESEYCQIVTGPNMGGKSCYIRQVALIAIMAQNTVVRKTNAFIILNLLQQERAVFELCSLQEIWHLSRVGYELPLFLTTFAGSEER